MGASRMTIEEAAVRFRELCAEAERLDLEGTSIEPTLVEILRLVEGHPEHRTTFVAGFASILGPSGTERIDAPWEVLPFCMHTLRWPEVRAAVQAELDTSVAAEDWRRINILSDYLASFEDRWESAEIFRHYTTAKA